MFIRASVFVLYFLLIGCTPKGIFIPDKLPDAVVGELYYTEIKITGGTSGIRSMHSVVTPNVLFVQPNPKVGRSDYNNLVIRGKPITTETITVKITGYTAPTLFDTDAKLEKTYIIKVKR